MFSMVQNRYMTSVLDDHESLHHKYLGPFPCLILKFEVCIVLLSCPNGVLSFISSYVNI